MLKNETWPIERFIEYARNPRKNDHAVDRVAAAIREFGFRVPMIVRSDGTVVDGHLRLKAAKKLGLIELPVVLADDLTPQQVKAFRLSVNKMAELAGWDEALLRLELRELGDMGFDLELTGFGLEEAECMILTDMPPIVDNSGNDDDRGNRTEPGKGSMVISIGKMSTLFDYEKTMSLCDVIRQKFGGDDGESVGMFCEELYEKYCHNCS